VKRLDVAVLVGGEPAEHPAGDRHPSVVRVERTHESRRFWAAGWMRSTDRPKPSPTVRIVASAEERTRRDGWADGLALSYVLARALLEGRTLDQAQDEMRRALPAGWRYRAEPCEPPDDPASPKAAAQDLFGELAEQAGTMANETKHLHPAKGRKRGDFRRL
jgi:hypothetical protein